MSSTIECETRQWGSSIGIVIPREVVSEEGIEVNSRVTVTICAVPKAKQIWGLGPVIVRKSTQEIKDELRKGW